LKNKRPQVAVSRNDAQRVFRRKKSMNTQRPNGNVIAEGNTYEHYMVMLQQSLAQTQEKAMQAQHHIDAARKKSKQKESKWLQSFTQKVKAISKDEIPELSPGTQYQHYVETVPPSIEQAPTTILFPLPKTPRVQQTNEIPEDISFMETVIQEDFDAAQMLLELESVELSPITPERLPRITKDLAPALPAHVVVDPRKMKYVQCESGHSGMRTLVETVVKFYRQDQDADPLLIEVSPMARSVIDVFEDWEEGYPGRSRYIPIVAKVGMRDSAARAWGV